MSIMTSHGFLEFSTFKGVIMKNTLLKQTLVLALAACAAASAQAVDVREVQGANVVFFYDADTWGADAFSVSGNSITFNMSDDFDLKAKSSSSSNTKTDSIGFDRATALVVVAKNGYALSKALSYGITAGSAQIANGDAFVMLTGDLNTGTMSGHTFTVSSNIGSYSVFNHLTSSGSLVATDAYPGSQAQYSTLGIGANLFLKLQQIGTGTSYASVDQVSYGFSVTAVPEPETYLMLGAGLGLVGFAARRRKQQA